MVDEYSGKPYVNTSETIVKAPDKKKIKSVVDLLANYVIRNTSYQFVNQNTGEVYGDVASVDVNSRIKMQSSFNDWKYWNGIVHMAMFELSRFTRNSLYSDYVRHNYEFFFNNIPFLKRMFEARVENADGHQFFRLDRLDDFGAMGAGLLELYQVCPDENYREYLVKAMDYICYRQDRLEDGTFCRNRFGYTSIWGDDLFMSVPFLVRAWQFSGDNKFLEDAVSQVYRFRELLYDSGRGLCFHSRIMQEGVPGVAYWGRANGWLVMAQCQLLKALPKDHKNREELISFLKEHLLGIARYQTGRGMWRQLLDKNDSFPESSATAMFVYAVACAVNEKWLPDIYASIAHRGWEALESDCVMANGALDKVSTGFNFKQDLVYYYNMPYEPGGGHGIGALLFAGVEMLKMKPSYRDCVWC